MSDISENAIETILQPVKDRLKDPFLSSLLLFEVVWNYEVVIYLLDFSLYSWEKVNLIRGHFESSASNSYSPLVLTLIYYFLYLPFVLPWLAAFRRKAEVKQENLMINEDHKKISIESRYQALEKLLHDEVQKNNNLKTESNLLNEAINNHSNELASKDALIGSYQSENAKNLKVIKELNNKLSATPKVLGGVPKELPVAKVKYSSEDFFYPVVEFAKKHKLSPKQAFHEYCLQLNLLAQDVYEYYPQNSQLHSAIQYVKEYAQYQSMDHNKKLKDAKYLLESWISNHKIDSSNALDNLVKMITVLQ